MSRNWLLALTGYVVLGCVEFFTAGGITQSTPETVAIFGFTVSLAALQIGLSFGSGLLSFQGSMACAELRSDPRAEWRKRATAARIVSSLLMVIPMVFFANAMALQVQRQHRLEYIHSVRYPADLASNQGLCVDPQPVGGCYVDSAVRLEAKEDLKQADEVKTARLDGDWIVSFFAALFIYGTLGWAGTALFKPRPETLWEAKDRRTQERAAKAAATRAAKVTAQAKAEARSIVQTVLGRLGFFRRAETRFVSPDAD